MPSVPEPRPLPRFLVPTLIAVLCLIWGSTWWAIRICLEGQPPLWSAALRFALAGGVMALGTPLLRRIDTKPPPPPWLWLTTGFGSFAGSYGILYVAEQHVPSGIAAVLWAIFPLLMAASGVFVLGEKLAARQVAGFVVSFLGIVAMFAGDLGGGAGLLGPALLLLCSPVVSAVSTTLVKKHGGTTSSVLMNRNGMLFGALLLAAAAWLREDPAAIRWSWSGSAALVYLAVVGTACSFGTYFWLLQRVPASRLALVSYVTPVLAMLLAEFVGDGRADVFAWCGTGAVVAGIALVVTRRKQ
ncbi:MAG: EamA family transporter [Planctomycetes bacterium]|nr:EamA family transporter [Planctomycetota bacterium]